MKAKTTNNKASAKKKLIPAAGSLLISAAMLSTSTFAWFTMSREVEVNNIKMTASVPEDIQISLGKLAVTGTPATAVTEATSDDNCLANSTGVLYSATAGASDNGNAADPENTWDWSNSVDISAYYDFGRLIPASSYNGAEIFFTPDANGVGKTVKASADYIQATNKLAAVNDSGTGTNKTYKATLHALTNTRDAQSGADNWATVGTGAYTQADAYNKTNDDGYYVDIPVWIRSSSNSAVNLSVDGYVLPGTNGLDTTNGTAETDLELYRAVRVAILDGEDVSTNANGAVACSAGDPAVTVASGNQKNIIPLKDAWDKTGSTAASEGKYTTIKTADNPYAKTLTSIVDSRNYKRAIIGAADMSDTDLYGVSAVASGESTSTDGVVYHAATYTQYNTLTPTNVDSGTPDTVATIEGSGTTGNQYGTAKKLIIRVWLDGEDKECWNDNAGQDWAISLRFSKIEPAAQQGGGSNTDDQTGG